MYVIVGSTFHSLNYHAVFSTKDRRPLIDKKWQGELHKYMAGTIVGLNGMPLCVGGVSDHVHLLFGLRATHCLADVIREIKKASSTWAHDVMKIEEFGWQEGYAAFSVSPTGRKSVSRYIEGQHVHHQRRSFRDELKRLLILAEIEFEDRYLD